MFLGVERVNIDFRTFFNVISLFTTCSFYFSKAMVTRNKGQNLKQCIESLGKKSIMYVKIFQALSGSSEIGTPELRELLNQYSDNVPFDENEVDYDDLLTSLNSVGNTYPELAIQHLNPKPFHSGTVSIVYEAELKTGQPIVVKVIRPNGLARMKQALKETMGLLRIINLIPKFRQLSLTTVIRENQPVLENQFCTYTELSNIQQYAQHFADDDEIIIPKVYPSSPNATKIS